MMKLSSKGDKINTLGTQKIGLLHAKREDTTITKNTQIAYSKLDAEDNLIKKNTMLT